MREKMILTAGPSITRKEIDYVTDAVTSGWNENWNGYLLRFERAFADYIGVRHAMTTSSGTGALHLSLKALGIKPGDEVIVPEVTWVASASTVTFCGATPVFADVEPDTWCMDPDSFRKRITSRTRAVMPVHLWGHPAEMDEINVIAREHGLFVIEDAAPSIGSTYHGRRTGSLGHIAAFSFQGAKIMVTGEGGMVVTDDEDLIDRVRFYADSGRGSDKPLWCVEIGYKYKMSNVQAALGLAQLERIEELIARKRLIFSWYRDRLGDVDGLNLSAERPDVRNIYQLVGLVLNGDFAITRDELITTLRERNVDSRPFFWPLSEQPMFEKANNPVAYHVSHRGISLPSGHNLTEDDVDYLCTQVKDLLGIEEVARFRRSA